MERSDEAVWPGYIVDRLKCRLEDYIPRSFKFYNKDFKYSSKRNMIPFHLINKPMGFYRDLVVYDIYKLYLCLEFDGGKVCTGIVGNDIGRSEVNIDPIELQNLLDLLRCKRSKETIYLKRYSYIDY